MKRCFKITPVCSLMVLESSLKSRCQQGGVSPGGFLESVSLSFQLPEPPTCDPSLPSLQPLLSPRLLLWS